MNDNEFSLHAHLAVVLQNTVIAKTTIFKRDEGHDCFCALVHGFMGSNKKVR